MRSARFSMTPGRGGIFLAILLLVGVWAVGLAAAPSPTSQPDAPTKFVKVRQALINLQHVNQIDFNQPGDPDGYYTIVISYMGDSSPHLIPIKDAAEAKQAWQILVEAVAQR